MSLIEDTELKQAVLDELESDPVVGEEDIGVSVDNGVVTLSGKVDNYAKKVEAERTTQRVRGVKAVAEKIVVEIPVINRPTDTEIAEAALHSLKWQATVPEERIKLKVENGWITLSDETDRGNRSPMPNEPFAACSAYGVSIT